MTNSPKFIDPFAAREAEKYENPIPSREAILAYLETQQKPLRFNDVAEGIGIDLDNEERVEAISRRLKAMLRDGQLMKNRRGQYGLIQKMNLIKGRVIGHADGFGFVTSEDLDRDLFLSAAEMQKVLHGDEVLVSVIGEDRRGRKEATIVEITSRNTEQLVGRISFEDGLAWVQPHNMKITQDVFVPDDGLAGAKEGQIVVVAIVTQPSRRHGPVGKVIEVVGDYMAAGMEIDSAIHAFGIPSVWPAEIQPELDKIPDEVLPEELAGREDIRSLPLVTIDGEDSKDFDDAVFAEKLDNGNWRLVVAIADVSHYVKPDSALDKEALKRGNSVYFPQRTIPMLPEKLSNGLCSLNPNVDRLCMVCDLEINAQGKAEKTRFYPGVMKSHARLTYNQVHAMTTDSASEYRTEFASVVAQVDSLYQLYLVLSQARQNRGALEFESVETMMLFDEDCKIDKIIPVVRNDAHKLIEECMLMANVAAARFLNSKEQAILFRVHQAPEEEKLATLRGFLGDFGLQLGGFDEPTAKDYAAVLNQLTDQPYAHLVRTVMLRSMSQAVYQPENLGHFGLNFEDYVHFTSPIRRYPDLLVHRALRQVADANGKHFNYSDQRLVELGRHCSDTERRADEATRDAENFLKCEFLSHRLGEEYTAVVSAVTNFGMFVELEDLYVEGLVHVTELGEDYFVYDQMRHSLRGERTGKTYRLGDKVKVQVAQVDVDTRKVDLRLIKDDEK